MKIDEKISVLEAILFSSGEPMESSKLAEAIEVDKSTLDKLVSLLNDKYSNCSSALKVYLLNDSYQLGTREEYSSHIKRRWKPKITLSFLRRRLRF